MYKKGDLVNIGAGLLASYLGGERTREKFDSWGNGGLFVGEVKVMVVYESQHAKRVNSRVGKVMWVERSRLHLARAKKR